MIRSILAAAACNDVPKICALIGRQAVRLVNTPDGKKWTPSFYSVVNRNYSATRELLGAGANPNAVNMSKATPLIELCKTVGKDCAWMPSAVYMKGAVVDAQDSLGRSSVHYCAQNNFPIMGEDLINQGATVDMRDNRYNTPLMLACLNGNLQMVELLLKKKANPNACTVFRFGIGYNWYIRFCHRLHHVSLYNERPLHLDHRF